MDSNVIVSKQIKPINFNLMKLLINLNISKIDIIYMTMI